MCEWWPASAICFYQRKKKTCLTTCVTECFSFSKFHCVERKKRHHHCDDDDRHRQTPLTIRKHQMIVRSDLIALIASASIFDLSIENLRKKRDTHTERTYVKSNQNRNKFARKSTHSKLHFQHESCKLIDRFIIFYVPYLFLSPSLCFLLWALLTGLKQKTIWLTRFDVITFALRHEADSIIKYISDTTVMKFYDCNKYK